ncbi:MAG TPA: hypothetical protein VM198_12650 [Longimicrobiales bacterium]|nr:hypothetical protein [Longimicrobiales bacterium]
MPRVGGGHWADPRLGCDRDRLHGDRGERRGAVRETGVSTARVRASIALWIALTVALAALVYVTGLD